MFPALARLCAAGRIAGDHQRLAVLLKIPGIRSFLRDLPPPGQAYAIRMDYPAETLAIDAPAQIRSGIDGSCDGLPKKVWRTERQDTSHCTRQRDVIDGQWRLAGPSPNLLVRVGEDGVTHFREARSPVSTIFLGNFLCPEKTRLHGVPRRWERGDQNSTGCNQSSPSHVQT